MDVKDRLIYTLENMYENNVIDIDNRNSYVNAINSWIGEINKLKCMLAEEKTKPSKYELPHEPIDVARMLINAEYARNKGDMEKALHKAFGNNSDTVTERMYSDSDLKEIAEHLLVYCDNKSGDD